MFFAVLRFTERRSGSDANLRGNFVNHEEAGDFHETQSNTQLATRRRIAALSLACLAAFAADPMARAADAAAKPDTLRSVMALYGLDEEQAIARMALEAEAAETWMRIRDAGLAGYAGAWFDGERLRVATNAAADHKAIEALDALPVAVEQSLQQLEAHRQAASQRLAAHGLISSHIDYASNRVVLGYDKAEGEARRAGLQQRLRQEGLDPARYEWKPTAPAVPSSGPLRGAEGTRNKTWDGPYYAAPCSIGVAIEGGFVTAGHCGYVNNDIHFKQGGYRTQQDNPPATCGRPVMLEALDTTDPKLGDVKSSLFPTTDSGWVETTSAWIPSPQINGYNDGILSVLAKWSGMQKAPVGTTVCRYGQSSGGPFCGTVEALDKTNTYYDNNGNTISTYGLTEVLGSCTVDGDSGGPWITPAGQVQGTMYGGVCPHKCPADPQNPRNTYFQPITDTLDAFGKIMLTAHGANPPTATVDCPGYMEGQFTCLLTGWYSQGDVSWQWSGGGGIGSGLLYSGPCQPGHPVLVQLALTNGYGTNTQTHSFTCPDETVIYQ